MTFDIRQHVEFNSKGRAQCPCCIADGKNGLNLALLRSGAYKCYRGCETRDIRAALGQPKDQITAPPPPSPSKYAVTSAKVEEAHSRLLKSADAISWLTNHGITSAMMKHYQLGLSRVKQGKGHLPAITIPIEVAPNLYGQKKRIAPWQGNKKWSQSGISATVYSTHSPPAAKKIWLCEGEWDAIALGWAVRHSELKNDIHIACFTCGAGNIPPANEIDKLPNVPIITLYDRDEPGETGAAKVQARFKDRVKIATVPAPDDAKEGWDISDTLNQGINGLIEITEATENAIAWFEPKRHNPLRERLVTNDELLARAADYQDFLIPDLLPADELIVMAGPPRGGKGFAALGMALGVAQGEKFLDRRCTQGSVLYVNLEDSETKIKQRQMQMEIRQDSHLPITWLDKFKLSELEHLIEIADEMEDLRLIIIDTLARARDDNNEEGSAKLSRILEPLQEYPKKRGICVLLVHHFGKVGESFDSKLDPFDFIRGSSAIRGTARGALLLAPSKDGHRLIVENGHAENLDIAIRRDPRTVAWKLCGNWTPSVDISIKDKCLYILNRDGQGTVAEIAHKLSLNARSVGNALSKLHAEDKVSKTAGKGRAPAVYSRSFTLLHQALPLGEACDSERERDTALLHQDPPCKENPPKVINGEQSDQCNDHFEKNPSSQPLAVKQSQKPESENDVCFTPPCETKGDGEAKCSNIYVGDRVKCSPDSRRYRLCGEKVLEVLDITEKGNARVKHEDWNVARAIPLSELVKLTD